MDAAYEKELLEKLSAYKTICEDLIMENKTLKEKINEYENNAML